MNRVEECRKKSAAIDTKRVLDVLIRLRLLFLKILQENFYLRFNYE